MAMSLIAALPVHADFLGKFGDWEAHARSDGGTKVCYAASVPQKSTGDYTKRGDIFLLVSHRPADKMFGFVSLEAGYTYDQKPKSPPKSAAMRFRCLPTAVLPSPTKINPSSTG